MLIYCGIDEAGYGPMLGPLCIGLSAFRVDDADPAKGPPDMWNLLSDSVCTTARDRRKRIAVADSKKLKGSSGSKLHPLRHLERGVLAFSCMNKDLPRTDAELLEMLDRSGSIDMEAPWNIDSMPIPVAHSEDTIGIASSMLARTCDAAGVRDCMLGCECIDVQRFNEQVQLFRNKSGINFSAIMRLVQQVRDRWPGEHPRVIIDRQGGRQHYLRPLQMTFPDASFEILGESERVSRYRLDDESGPLTLSFETASETTHLPVALASMVAKYTRELMMRRLNCFFTREVPDLDPTAGYVQDARRYLVEVEPVIKRLGVPREQLVRSL